MLVNSVTSELARVRGLLRAPLATWNCVKVHTALSAVALGVLGLLCACAGQTHPAEAPEESARRATTAIATSISAPQVSVPGPVPSATLEGRSYASELTTADADRRAADVAVQASGLVQVMPGETNVYTLTLRNDGPDWATGLVVTDTLPSGVIPIWTQPGRPSCSRQGTDVSCDLGELQGGDAFTATLDLSVGGPDFDSAGAEATGITVDLWGNTCIFGQELDRHLVVCHLARLEPGGVAALQVYLEHGPALSDAPEHTVTAAANESDANRLNNSGTFALVAESAESGRTSVEPASTGTAPSVAADLEVQAHGPSSVIAGQPFTHTFVIRNQGTPEATGARLEYTLPPATVLLSYSPSLPPCQQTEDVLTCYLSDPHSSEPIAVTLVITGSGGQPVLMGPDPLVPGWPICSILKERTYLHIVNCEFGSLRAGQAAEVELLLVAEGIQEREIINTALVAALTPDPTPLDNTATTTVTVQVSADLSLQSAISGPVRAGEMLSYSLTVANLGPSEAAYVTLTDVLPVGAALVSAVPSQGRECRTERVDDLTQSVICELGSLHGGTAASVSFLVTIAESLVHAPEELIVHTATVVSEQSDPDSGNNELIESIPVVGGILE